MHRPRWQQEGKEPDYRFSLANERTFLAWIRTALSLLAAGVLLEQFAVTLQPRGVLVALALLLAVLACLLSAGAYQRWKSNEIAMRCGQSLPHGLLIPVTAAALLVVAAVLAGMLLL
ncbi:Putative inner membrane protein [plant metagenome]|uniref:Inner membrane protein n=1 Tax=plant metagenome TaxID=1297885 RepID=A0A484YDV8_9ZZZZ